MTERVGTEDTRSGPTDEGMPSVTIAIPTYMRADGYLREALQSAVDQDYAKLEILVSDNASPDDTGAVVRQIGGDRVRYVRHETSLGPKGNADFCLSAAQGEYFLLLHDDDRIDPDFVSSCMQAISDRRPGLVRTGTRTTTHDGSILYVRPNMVAGPTTYDLLDAWFTRNTSMYFCSTMFHTATLRATGGLVSREGYFDDVAAYIRVSAAAGHAAVRDAKASYRRHDESRGGAAGIEVWCKDSLYIIDLIVDTLPERSVEMRERATRFFSENNYHRAARLPDPHARSEAFDTVHRMLPSDLSPRRFQRQQLRRDLRRRMRSWLR